MLLSLFLSSLCAQGGTTILIDELVGVQDFQRLGHAITDMGDVNGDGVTDFATTSAGFDFARPEWGEGRVEVISGATLQPLFHRDARGDIDFSIGDMLQNLGDINGDGINDLFISASGPVFAYVVSGVDGTLLYRMVADDQSFLSPDSMDSMTDINGDGVQEFLIGFWAESWVNPRTGDLAFQAGAVRMYDGATGRLLQTFRGQKNFQGLGKEVAGVGDLNGDGMHDIVVLDAGFGLHNFTLRAFSSADGSEIYTLEDSRIDTLASLSVDALDDFDGDGTNDLLLSAHTNENQLGHTAAVTVILSGIDGHPLETIRGRSYPWPGREVRTIGDFNGDGMVDFALGEPLLVNGIDHYSVRVISGRDLAELAVIDSGSEHWFGSTFASVEDLDGDGRNDLMIGLPNAIAAGHAFGSQGVVQLYALH